MQPGLIKWIIKNNKHIRLMAIMKHIRVRPGATRREAIIQVTTAIVQITAAITRITAVATFLTWSAYIWLNVETFGSTPECNAQVKILGPLLRAESATKSTMRIIWLIAMGLSAGFIITATILIIREELKGIYPKAASSKSYSTRKRIPKQ